MRRDRTIPHSDISNQPSHVIERSIEGRIESYFNLEVRSL